ncbi:MAG: DUF2306 domain-containing protein [Sphingomonadales bacterium]|nr:DUF2306 domain-containing protein [Sphingomonadales bacterium]
MNTAAFSPVRVAQQRFATVCAALLSVAMLAAAIRRAASAAPFLPSGYDAIVMLHVITVAPALPLGVWLFATTKGDATHRLLGRVWAVLILVTAVTSFGIHQITGHLSVIHILSVITIVSVVRGVLAARKGNIVAHRSNMIGAFTGITIAGLFTFLPGRLMAAWLFG